MRVEEESKGGEGLSFDDSSLQPIEKVDDPYIELVQSKPAAAVMVKGLTRQGNGGNGNNYNKNVVSYQELPSNKGLVRCGSS